MQDKDSLRQTISLYIAAAYLLPVLFLCGYGVHLHAWKESWIILTGGILLGACGTLLLFVKMWQWESGILEEVDLLADSKAALRQKQPVNASLPVPSNVEETDTGSFLQAQKTILHLEQTLAESQTQYQEILNQLRKNSDESYQLVHEKEELQQQLEQTRHELAVTQQTTREQMKQKDVLLAEYAQTVNDLRGSMDKKQQQIIKLESSVRDLTYEVKTLLQLSDVESAPVVPPPAPIPAARPVGEMPVPRPSYVFEAPKPVAEKQTFGSLEATSQLKRCIDIAQKLTSANHFGMSSRFRDLSVDSYALEQRRLFDSLQSENTNLVLVYSQKDNKLLFANNHSKSLLGWSPEKFIQDFPDLIQSSQSDWKKALSSLNGNPEAQVKLMIKTRSGTEHSVQCHLGLIPTGIFKNHVIGVLVA